MRARVMPMMEMEREDSRDIDKAFDDKYDPHYGEAPEGQFVSGGTSFAELRDEMSRRRRQTARRMGC